MRKTKKLRRRRLFRLLVGSGSTPVLGPTVSTDNVIEGHRPLILG
jgi:hypothetical protein